MTTLVESIRWYVVAVAALNAVIGAPVLWRRWRTYKIENKYAWLAIVALNFSVGYGTAESLVRHIEGGPRSLVLAIAITWLLVAVAYHPVENVLRWRRNRRLIDQYQPKRLRAPDADQRNPRPRS